MILSIITKCKWGGGPPPKAVVEGYQRLRHYPSVSRLSVCHLPIWLRKMERNLI